MRDRGRERFWSNLQSNLVLVLVLFTRCVVNLVLVLVLVLVLILVTRCVVKIKLARSSAIAQTSCSKHEVKYRFLLLIQRPIEIQR